MTRELSPSGLISQSKRISCRSLVQYFDQSITGACKIKTALKMANFAPAPHKPDSRIFASYPMPAKIDLINERPRRESLIEKQLANKIGAPVLPTIEITEQHRFDRPIESYQTVQQYQQPQQDLNNQTINNQTIDNMVSQQQSRQQVNVDPQIGYQRHNDLSNPPSTQVNNMQSSTITQTTTTSTFNTNNNAAILAADLAKKEANLMAEITALHERPYSPFQLPAKIDLTSEQRITQQQYQNAPSPRPFSRASSTKSTSADLADKEAKLLQEIEEMEKKPYNPQTMVVEREQWYEYPEGRPNDYHLTDSKRRVKDFCSMPSYMYQDQGKHIHEEIPVQGRQLSSASSIHTTILRSPKRDVDNKSPLPFAFDNFTTKGVRGNIASVGAIEPDRPRAPIYPIIKRSPSPNIA